MRREANCGNDDEPIDRSLVEDAFRRSSSEKQGFIFWIKNSEGLQPIEHLKPDAIMPTGQHAQVNILSTIN
jgi:hypothetical protein